MDSWRHKHVHTCFSKKTGKRKRTKSLCVTLAYNKRADLQLHFTTNVSGHHSIMTYKLLIGCSHPEETFSALKAYIYDNAADINASLQYYWWLWRLCSAENTRFHIYDRSTRATRGSVNAMHFYGRLNNHIERIDRTPVDRELTSWSQFTTYLLLRLGERPRDPVAMGWYASRSLRTLEADGWHTALIMQTAIFNDAQRFAERRLVYFKETAADRLYLLLKRAEFLGEWATRRGRSSPGTIALTSARASNTHAMLTASGQSVGRKSRTTSTSQASPSR